MVWINKPNEDCIKYWPEAAKIKWTLWRFAWLKRGCNVSAKIDAGGFRYLPLCGRLWFCDRWLGTRSNLFPFRVLIRALPALVIVLALVLSVCHSCYSLLLWAGKITK